MMDANAINQKVIATSREIFSKHYSNKFKKDPKLIHTVLSSFSLLQKQSGIITAISIGFGTKSLPYLLAKQHPHRVLKDMHAEILSRRGFCRFLQQSLPPEQQENQYFEWSQKKQKHKLKAKFIVVLYSSENFCGDCMVDSEHSMFSGARPLKYFSSQEVPQQKYTKFWLRTKPGRLDLPLSKRSLSLSCSDKIGVWNLLGIQGKRLFNEIMPVYIDRVIVQACPGQEKAQIESGINLLERISQMREMAISKVYRKTFKIRVNSQERNISNQFKHNVPLLFKIQKSKDESQVKSLDICGVILQTKQKGEEVSWLNGKTGLPEGVNINKQYSKVSPFASQKIYQEEKRNEKEEFKYHAVKSRVKMLFGEWTDDFK